MDKDNTRTRQSTAKKQNNIKSLSLHNVYTRQGSILQENNNKNLRKTMI